MKKTRNVDRETIRIFWQACLQDRRMLLKALLFPLGALLLTVAVPVFIGRIIAALSLPGGEPMSYAPYLLAVSVLGIICNRIGAPALFQFQAHIMSYLQEKAFSALMCRSMGFHNDNVGGKLVSDATDYPSSFSQLLDSIFTNLLPFVLILVAGSVVVFIESWQLGLVISTMVVYAVGSAYYFNRKRAPLRVRRLAASKAVTSHLADAIVNVATVKTFARESQELYDHQRLNTTLHDIRVDDWGSAAREGNLRIAILLVMELVFVFVLIRLIENDPDILAIGIFAFSFITMMSARLFMINVMLRQVEDGLLNASPMTEVLLSNPEIKDREGAKELVVTEGRISINGVHFRYADDASDNHVFERLDMEVAAGEKIGLVGPSGGGKSTLTRLLLRFDDIESGTIAIDDQDIAAVTQTSLRQSIAYVPQEPLLFHRTIAENISYGREDAARADIEKAARLAHAHDFIGSLPEGYDTIVGERGVKLSGGQRQRIAIARAILKDAPILILDEATSALDSESEVFIQDALWKLMQGRTALVIAHRLSTVQKMDRIVVLEDGRITEQGSHAALLKRKGTYARLWSHQSGGFMEE